MYALQNEYTNKSKHLAVYLVVSLWGTACTRVHVLAAGGLHGTAMFGVSGALQPLPCPLDGAPAALRGDDAWFPTPFTSSLPTHKPGTF